MHDIQPTDRVSLELHHAISQHAYTEARMLQNHQYKEWLEGFVAEDIHFWMPVIERRYRKDKRPAPGPDDMAIYSDDYSEVKQRVDRMYTGTVWMEDPASDIKYLLTNIEAFHTEQDDLFKVYTNVAYIRHRQQLERSEHIGAREDLLRKVGDKFQLVRRKIVLDARVTIDKNLYFFG
ncbi:MAG TPA: 3-phenylpropionate/cinnamic acid dioxygenase subunit beta [Cycloclasticus sp.]|nr:3-phenylpropionate/cinnamic acid dioxygenase subunit beta [Cycloclasticus sp.]